MPLKNQKTQTQAKEEPKGQEPEKEQGETNEEPQESGPKEPEARKTASSEMVLVRNVSKFDYVQPSTGIKVRMDGGPTEVKDDGWIKRFVDAKLMEYV